MDYNVPEGLKTVFRRADLLVKGYQKRDSLKNR